MLCSVIAPKHHCYIYRMTKHPIHQLHGLDVGETISESELLLHIKLLDSITS